METIDNKLNPNNPVLISEVFSKLVENITDSKNEKQGFVYLKNKCLSSNSSISEVAGAAILKLVENRTLQLDQVLADFVTSISTARVVDSLIKIINKLICLYYLQKSEISKVPHIMTMQVLHHPFIKILQGDCSSDTQMCMYNEIIRNYKDSRLSSVGFEIYQPLYLYCLCSPTSKIELSLLRHKLWSFLINNNELIQNDILKLCSWMQMQNKTKCELSGILIDEALQRQLRFSECLANIDQMILLEILIVYNMILNNGNCCSVIETIIQSISKFDFCHHNLSLLILSKAILACSPLYLEDLLKLCLLLLRQKCHAYSYLAIKSSILPWIASPSILTENALKIADEILKANDQICQPKPAILASRLSIDKFHFVTFCNPEIFLALQLGIKRECMKGSEIHLFVEKLERVPVHFLRNSFSFLCGLLLSDGINTEDKVNILSLIVKCSLHFLELLPAVLTLILYLLSNTKESKLLFELLRALPLMSKVKENVPKVIATVQGIANKSNDLKNFAMRLMYDTWEIDSKCYSNLETILNEPRRNISEKDVRELYISKAYIFKKLSGKRPEVYGVDLVAHLSKILNECTGTLGALPSALAIEGISYLCKAEIIDIVTTWATLAPKFKDDTRVPVIKSLCQLLSEIPHLQYTQAYEKLNDEVIQHLWNYVITNDNEEVVNSALDALASFSLELICTHMPQIFLDEHFAKENSVEGQRIVPGKTWMTFLKVCKSKKSAKHFLIKLVSNEIDNYLKYVYQVKAKREPENYGGLPTHSIVRALGDFIKQNATKVKNWTNTEKESLYIDCLEILSLKYSKPLPPLDWSFLTEIIHNPKLRNACLDLASRQAILSGSARRLVESYICAVTESVKDEDVIPVYRNLKYIANSIQPMIIKPFIQNSLNCAFNTFKLESTFVQLLDYLKEVLRDSEVQHINKNVIEDVLRQLIFITDVDSQAFPLFLDCIRCFSQKGLEEVTKFDPIEFVEAGFKKIAKIRCYIAEQVDSKMRLNWLNEIFDVGFKNNIRVEDFFEDMTNSLVNNINNEDSPIWLKEQFGQIQAKVAERCELPEIEYFCDILTVAVVYFSGFFVLLPNNDFSSIKYFFPASLAFLLDDVTWSNNTTHILEWLYHMNSAENIPREYQKIFGWSLCCLRHQEEFSRTSKWMKYLDCKIYTDYND